MMIGPLCPTTVQDALVRAATLAPDLEAIVAPDGRMTFGELGVEVARVRAALASSGVRAGDHIGICLGNGLRFLTLFLALGTLGAVSVPINTRLRADEIAYALRQSRVTQLFTADRLLSADFIGLIRRFAPGIDTGLPDAALPDLHRVIVDGGDVPAACIGWDGFMAKAGADPGPQAKPQDILLIQYTSGTTALPKGVMLRQHAMLTNGYVSGLRMGLRAGDRFHSARPFFHVAGTTLSILSCLQNLTTLVTMQRFEPAEALRLMEAERCTHFSGNDTMALMLLNHPDRATRRLSLRGAWVAGAETALRRVAAELGAQEVVSGYGLSEASPNVAQSCWWEPLELRVSGKMQPQPGLEVVVADPATGAALAIGDIGEIRVRGWSVMAGYHDMPDRTAEALTPDGWLLTGDLGRLDAEGRLEFMGRLKNIVRVGGENVSPEEVENIFHRHPAVKQAQIVGVPDDRLVEVCAAFVILNEGDCIAPEALLLWAKDEMAGFKVPRHLWIVGDFDEIGMTASAKVQKTKLAAHARHLLTAAKDIG
ncbi:AMP-binding protein [Tabrizicola fusiformis]|uniref:AMP-binding protein n=1 Tax=Tabrizicola sp. SY72 TaxID=2741673 RepID=UPI001572937F|nr:AMP-binding protein [Tabrizicola sp. SY72]NTT87891.1 AMP-binding protein [Tabrizicola sp. SY72]